MSRNEYEEMTPEEMLPDRLPTPHLMPDGRMITPYFNGEPVICDYIEITGENGITVGYVHAYTGENGTRVMKSTGILP